MSETKETTEKTILHANVRKPLSLTRTVETGHVQQKVGQRRMKSVEVVKKKKRSLVGPAPEEAAPPSASRPVPKVARRAGAETPRAPGTAGTAMPRSLSDKEVESRAKALEAARSMEAEKVRLRAQAEEARRRLDLEAQAQLQTAEGAARPQSVAQVEESADVLAEPAAPVEAAPSALPPLAQSMPERRAETVAGEARAKRDTVEPVAEAPPAAPPARTKPRPESVASQPILKQPVGMTRPEIVLRTDRPKPKPKPPEPAKKAEAEAPRRTGRPAASVTALVEEDEGRTKKKGQKTATRPIKAAGERVRGKLTITNAFDEQQRQRSLASLRRKQERAKRQALGLTQQREKIAREVVIPEVITIQELANRMTERAVDVIKVLMKQGALHKINDVIDADTAELLVHEFGHTARRVSEADVEEGFIGDKDAEEMLEPRAPVVTIMGHVDHGKTSLLDAIRHANVAAGEAGGITQHIGAYQVLTPEGRRITFIDTPGHEAFTAMRARGAKVTDIVVLVVAADDGVMPQTVEAINHAKAAGVPLIVAINKIDKPDADPSRVRTELLQHEVVVESLSGETLEVPVSALQRTNLDKLLEAIVLQAEILDLKANPNRSAEGYVIEAKLERGRGPVGTLLVQRGALRVGDIVVAGMTWGRVRALIDDKGQNVKEAGPAVPAEVLGFDAAPEAGDQFAVVESEGRAREITDYRARKRRETLGPGGSARTLEQMMQQLKEEGKKEFQLVVKGDVQGSVEAIAGALKKLGTEEVEARIVHSGVGGITESDVALASASQAVIVGFNVRANVQAKSAAERDGVEIRYYNIIYDLVNDVKSAMSGLLAPTIREVFLGNAEILEVFNISKVGKVAGCRVTEGKVERGARVRLIRDSVVMHEGTLSTLKRFKDEVKEVPAGQECGMAFANYQDIRQGDVIECFRVETVVRTL